MSFSPDGRRVASVGGYDQTVRLWDVEQQVALGAPLKGHTSVVNSVSFSPDGRRVASGSRDQTVRLWDVEQQVALGAPLAGHTGEVSSVSFSSNGRRVASGSRDQTVRLWDVEQQVALGAPLVGHTGDVVSVSFSPDGHHVASGSEDKTVRLWDVEKQVALSAPLAGHTSYVTSVSFSPDGRRVASGSADKTVRLWDVEQQVALGAPLVGHTSDVVSVSFSPDGRRLVSAGGGDLTVRLWDVEQQVALGASLEGHTSYVTSVSFSPNGRRIASGSRDQTVRLWDVGQQIALGAPPLAGHTGEVSSVSFSSDGHCVVSGSLDNTVRLWDVTSGRCVAVLRWQQAIYAVAMIPAKTSFTIPEHSDSKSSRRPAPTPLSAGEDLLAIGDGMGTISFWAVSRQEATIRFLGMPRHAAMPLCADGIVLQGCRMDALGKRLLAQYGAQVERVLVEIAEEKEEKFSTLLGQKTRTNEAPLETQVNSGSSSPLSASVSQTKPSILVPERKQVPKDWIWIDTTEEKQVKSNKAKPQLSATLAGLFKHQPHYSNQELLTQAYHLFAIISHAETKQRYLAKLDYYREKIDTLSKADREELKELIKDLRRLHNNPTSASLSPAHLTTPDQKHQSKLPFSFKNRLWSTPKPIPPATSSSSASSSSSNSSSMLLYSSASSSRSSSTSSTSTTTTLHK